MTTNPVPAAPTTQDALHALLCEVLPPQGAWNDFREPDLLLLRDRADTRCQDRYWLGADLVAEVISPDNPDPDLVEKRADYAEAGIPEYWVVDPRDETIRVLTLCRVPLTSSMACTCAEARRRRRYWKASLPK